MTYNEFINNIIETRGQGNIPKGEYYEVHHIIPQCMGGEPLGKAPRKKHENLIWLYPQEHFIAHKLLYLENPDNNDLFFAGWMMAFVTSGNQERYEITPEEHVELVIYKSKVASEFFSNLERSPEWCKHISESQKGIKRGHWYNNGEYSVQSFECPEGFVPGRLKKDIEKIVKTKKDTGAYNWSPEFKSRISNTIKSKKYHGYNNGVDSIQIPEGEEIPEGYVPGHIGYRGCTNGEKDIMININEELPEGYRFGHRTYSKGYINNND